MNNRIFEAKCVLSPRVFNLYLIDSDILLLDISVLYRLSFEHQTASLVKVVFFTLSIRRVQCT